MKNIHQDYFKDGSLSQMVLRRYDGETFSASLAEMTPSDFRWWIADKSTKPVEKLSQAVVQLTDIAHLATCIVYTDYS